MAKLPYMQFYPDDYRRDTAPMSLAAKGAWMDILCSLWHSQNRGTRTLTELEWSRLLGCEAEQASRVIAEIARHAVGNVEVTSDGTTITCRRMVREEHERELTRQRVAKFRGGGPETPKKRGSNGAVTPEKPEARGQSIQSPKPPLPGTLDLGGGAIFGSSSPKKPKRQKRIAFDLNAPPPDPRHHPIMSRYGAHYADIVGAAYKCDGGKDGKALAKFLGISSVTVDEFLETSRKALCRRLDDPFVTACKQGVTIHGICSSWNEIIAELKTPERKANGAHHASEKPVGMIKNW